MNKIDNILLIKLIDKVDELELKISNLEKMVNKIFNYVFNKFYCKSAKFSISFYLKLLFRFKDLLFNINF